ncbi:MAG: MarR family winged helix-turn-helix transcriptional regulator [Candidatus Promineifilaceae bacterium]|jgi:DNA-binding MarR family transcriptional regulator
MDDRKEIYDLLNEIYLILDDGDRRLFSQFDLTPPRYYALVHIGHKPGISISNLSDLMLCDKSNATRIVKGLEGEGLVYRLPHETDGRTLRLFLTKSGEEIRRKAINAHTVYNEKRFEDGLVGMDDELKLDLIELKKHLRASLELSTAS